MDPLKPLRIWHTAGRRVFIRRLAAAGLAAGLASWLLTLALSPLLGVGPPSLAELLLALTLGASLGALLALALDAWWTRRSADRS